MASEEKEERIKVSDEQLAKVVEEVTEGASKEAAKSVDKFIDAVFVKGFAPMDALGLKPEMIEGLYGQAYRLYNTGNYREAMSLFRLLLLLNVTEPKYAMGLASSMHMMKHYEPATQMYAICAILDPNNPVPHYHASDCWVKIGDPASALISLELAVERAGDDPQYKQMKDRCNMTIKKLKEELEKQGAFKSKEELAAEKKQTEQKSEKQK